MRLTAQTRHELEALLALALANGWDQIAYDVRTEQQRRVVVDYREQGLI